MSIDDRVERFSDLLPTPVALLEKDGAVRYMNGAFASLFGQRAERLSHLTDRLHPADVPIVHAAIAHAFERGAASAEVRISSPAGPDRVCQLRLQFDAQQQRTIVTATDLTAERDIQRSLLEQTLTDPLTGLANRAGLVHALETAHRSGQWGRIVALADLDRFKRVNDTLGHQWGDELLKVIAERFRRRMPYATIGRLGGDEFVAIVPPGAGMDPAAVGDEIRGVLDSPISLGSREISLALSVGLVLADGSESSSELLQKADIAAYEAKRRGRNKVVIADQVLLDSIQGALMLESELPEALARAEFLPWFQPVVAVATREPTGFESLMRWRRDGAVVAAGDFVDIASESGHLPDISASVRRKTIEIVAQTDPAILFGMNMSPEELLDGQTPGRLGDLCREYGVESSRIVLEVTEQTLISDLDGGANVLHGLIDDGFRVALDDFGHGHSSLTYLTRLPFATVKLGGDFVVGARAGGRALNTLHSIHELLTKLGHEVVVEGVETEEDDAIVRSIDGVYAQGWLYGRPGPIEQWLPAASEEARR